jgi:hypothetical protein
MSVQIDTFGTADAEADAECLRLNWNDHSPFSNEAFCPYFGTVAVQVDDPSEAATYARAAARAAFKAVPGLRGPALREEAA